MRKRVHRISCCMPCQLWRKRCVIVLSAVTHRCRSNSASSTDRTRLTATSGSGPGDQAGGVGVINPSPIAVTHVVSRTAGGTVKVYNYRPVEESKAAGGTAGAAGSMFNSMYGGIGSGGGYGGLERKAGTIICSSILGWPSYL